MTRSTRRKAPDRGAAVLVVAISMLVILGFAALVVDLGAGFNERAQDQSAADVGALAAVQFATVDHTAPGCAGKTGHQLAVCNGVFEAMQVAQATLDSPRDWSDSSLCDAPPAIFTEFGSTTSCVAFSANLQEAWVQTPTVALRTTFANTIGFGSVSVAASAQARTDAAQRGKLLPFGLPGASADLNETCLRVGSNAIPNTPCDATNTSGNFGTLDFALYGNTNDDTSDPPIKTSTTCNGNAQDALSVNMAIGVDHPIGTWIAPSGEIRKDLDGCNQSIFAYNPNQVSGQDGKGSNLYDGIAGAVTKLVTPSTVGRLAQNPEVLVENGSALLDNTSLWSYIDPTFDLKPGSDDCDAVNTNAQMILCLEAWKSEAKDTSTPLPAPLFSKDIAEAVRFSAVPELYEPTFGHGKKPYLIVAIRPTYLNTTYWGCNPGGCKIVFTPGTDFSSGGAATDPCPNDLTDVETCGLGSTVNGANRIDALSAIVMKLEMLPSSVRDTFPTTDAQRVHLLTR